MDTKTKRVIVTGASSGIGRATARLFLDKGDRVALLGRRREALDESAGTFLEGGSAIVVPADLSNEDETEAAVAKSVELMGGLDLLVNAAGILKSGDIGKTSLGLWDETMNLNLRSVFHIM